MTDDVRETERRIAEIRHEYHTQISDLQTTVAELKTNLVEAHKILNRLEMDYAEFGVVISLQNLVDPVRFSTDDQVVVVDPASPQYRGVGVILSRDDNMVKVRMENGLERIFNVGTEQEKAQVRLADKADGTFAIVSVGGAIYRVMGAPELELNNGDAVIVSPKTKQILGHADYTNLPGVVTTVTEINEEGIVLTMQGDSRYALNPKNCSVEVGDKVLVEPTGAIILKKLPDDKQSRYRLASSVAVAWEDVGGLEQAKKEIIDAIEYPYRYKDHFAFYNKKRPNGVLLWGPPGNGKTLLVRAAATSMAKIHGQEIREDGCLIINGPEVLSKWVGNSEAEIRGIFHGARMFFRKYGFPQLIAFDEFESLAPQRGTRRSSDIADTIVPTFLSEMDGVDSEDTKANPILFMLTNRPDILDPAIIRHGRVSKHVKIGRPDSATALQILKIHTRDVPFADESMPVLAFACQNIFSKNRLLYRINNEHDFTLGDCVSGAMLEAVCESAKMEALHRDIVADSKTGLTGPDFRAAVESIYNSQKGLNHQYDLSDFADRHGLQFESMKVDRCFGAI